MTNKASDVLRLRATTALPGGPDSAAIPAGAEFHATREIAEPFLAGGYAVELGDSEAPPVPTDPLALGDEPPRLDQPVDADADSAEARQSARDRRR